MKHIFKLVVAGAVAVWSFMMLQEEHEEEALIESVYAKDVVESFQADKTLSGVLSNLTSAGSTAGVYNLCNGKYEVELTECEKGFRIKSTVDIPVNDTGTKFAKTNLEFLFNAKKILESYEFSFVE